MGTFHGDCYQREIFLVKLDKQCLYINVQFMEFVARGYKSNFSMDIVGVFAIFSACLDHPTTYSSTYWNEISDKNHGW